MLMKNSEWPPVLDDDVDAGPPNAGLAGRVPQFGKLLAGAFRNAAAFVAARRVKRQQRQVLSQLDDRMLKDIGIDRRDLPGWPEGEIRGWSSLQPWE
jgi:uncharacterized protein YjiS (DUF1127 family)